MGCSAFRELFGPEIEETHEAGRKEGRAEERESTTRRLNRLNQRLLSAGRIADLNRSFTDSAFQNKLLKEYGL